MNAVTLFQPEGVTCRVTDAAVALRDAALFNAALVGYVRTPEENETANNALRDIKAVLKQIEDARKAVKEPVLELGRRIDHAAKEFIADLKDEELRIAKASADFQTEQLERVRAQEAARQAEIARIESERRAEQERLEAERRRIEAEAKAKADAELAAARNAKEQEAAEARAKAEAERIAKEAEAAAKRAEELKAQEIESLKPVAAPVKAEGQTVRPAWLFEVTDLWLLARTSPALVRIEPNRQEINEVISRLAERGEPKIAGLRIWREVKVGVRLGHGKVVDV